MRHQPVFDGSQLSSEWFIVSDTPAAEELEQELKWEVAAGHVLAAFAIVAIAVRRLQKEAIFWLPESDQWAVVHLTWNDEVDPRWPSTVLVESWADVLSELVDRGRA